MKQARVPHAVAGGYAVALHGAVRGTVDVDLVIQMAEEQFQAAENALSTIGLVSRLPVGAREVFQFRREYMENRNLFAWGFVNPTRPSEMVDIVLTHDLGDLRTLHVQSQERRIPVVSIDDLIMMKEASGRPQDLADVDALRRLKRTRRPGP